MNPRVLDEATLRRAVGTDQQSLLAVEQAFTWLQQGRVNMPPIMHIHAADRNGDVDVKSAYVEGVPYFAIKIASGFYDNPARGLPAGNAMMVLLDSATGFCEALLLDNGYLTDLRTGMAGAVAARYLAPRAVETVGVLGTGIQARYQVQCLALVRRFERVLVWGRDMRKARECAADLARHLPIRAEATDDITSLARQSQVLYTTTPSRAPLLPPEALHPGMLVCAVGADFPGKQELHPQVLRQADRLVVDSLSQCLVNGELQHLAVGGQLPAGLEVDELGQLTAGTRPGRTDEDQVIVCDLTGTGVQDTAIANLAYRRATGTDT